MVRYASVATLQHRRILGERIRQQRSRARITQEILAEKAELSAKYVGEVERASVNISVDALVRVARALHVQVHDLTRGF